MLIFELESEGWCRGGGRAPASHCVPQRPTHSLIAAAGFAVIVELFLENQMPLIFPNVQQLVHVVVRELLLLE